MKPVPLKLDATQLNTLLNLLHPAQDATTTGREGAHLQRIEETLSAACRRAVAFDLKAERLLVAEHAVFRLDFPECARAARGTDLSHGDPRLFPTGAVKPEYSGNINTKEG